MSAASETITCAITLELIGPTGTSPVDAELIYDPADPYAVTVVFHTLDGQVTWLFGRDLLIRGSYERVGRGDVQVFPSLDADGRAVVVLELGSPAGHALAQAQARDVLGFLARSTRAVWPGTESDFLSLDAAIDALLVEG